MDMNFLSFKVERFPLSYALLVFRNSNLKSLWKPKKLHVRKGLLSFHSNAYLCKSEINALGKMVVGNTSKAITETKNGYLGSCK